MPEVTDRRQALEALEAQLAGTPRASRPYEHAAIAYRLGLVYAESPVGNASESLRKALACYDVAAAIFDPRSEPVEHARVLNAAGAAQRALGDSRRAAGLFEKAAELLDGRQRESERAAALNNLGLARTELGELKAAVEAFDVAADLFDTTTADGRRGRVATLHNRGQAHAAEPGEEGVEAALADYEEARADLDPDEAPYHHGLVSHSIGVACSALAEMRPSERETLAGEAIKAFKESLTVFTRGSFPFQYALAKHNLGLAYVALGGAVNLRRALACFEDAAATLDTRVHAAAWRQAYASLERTEKELESIAPGMQRADHFAALIGASRRDERNGLIRERLLRLLALPDPSRRSALVELALASAQLDGARAAAFMEAELGTLMELPNEHLELALRARLDAHARLPEAEREEADRALDRAIGEALQGPQRIYVRDFLYSMDWERP
ncbi:MAG: soluble NSF attachment family protein [Actinomycetota bacterium]|nr:soluble NSF attachment family protein [Actinomycetota bacterium]